MFQKMNKSNSIANLPLYTQRMSGKITRVIHSTYNSNIHAVRFYGGADWDKRRSSGTSNQVRVGTVATTVKICYRVFTVVKA